MYTPAQVPETLLFDDEPLLMCTAPLDPWLASQRIELRSEHESPRCMRRYLGNWELRRGHLYLVSVRPFGGKGTVHVPGAGEARELTRSSLFPEAGGPVCAQWFTGQLRCPLGQILRYQDMSHDSVYERDMLVDISSGRVERIVFRHNDFEPMRVVVPSVCPQSGRFGMLPLHRGVQGMQLSS